MTTPLNPPQIGSYCSVCLPENRRYNPGFILSTTTEQYNRKTLSKYLVAHQFDISWFYEVSEPIEGIDVSGLCRPHATLVDWRHLPEGWVESSFGDPIYGWDYVGPKYWDINQ